MMMTLFFTVYCLNLKILTYYKVMLMLLKHMPLFTIMSFNKTKCKCMLVSHRRAYTSPDPVIYLYGHSVEQVSAFKYLGLLLTSNLSWSAHIKSVCSKARKLLGLIYRRFYKYSSELTLRQLYLSLMWPHLEYAASLWSPYLQNYINMLEKIQQFINKNVHKTMELELPRTS